MNPNSRFRIWFFVALTCLTAFAPRRARAQAFYVVIKQQAFVQTSSAGPVPESGRGFGFGAEAATNVTLTLPAGGTQPLVRFPGDDEFSLDQGFATKAALDAAYPNGTYRMTGTGIPTLSFNLTTDAYATATPQVTGGTWNSGGLLVVDPTQTVTINFNTNTSYATAGLAGHMEFDLSGPTDNLELNTSIATVPIFGTPATAAPFTSFTIPAGRLISGRPYWAELSFDTVTTFDTTSAPGAVAAALFSKSTRFAIAALAPGAVAPPIVINTQPTNQTGVPGGSVTFPLNFTVGGVLNQFSTASLDWFFNGRRINFDGSKYVLGPNGPSLRVNNLNAADVGVYSVRVIGVAGVLDSAPATLTLAAAAAPVFTRQPSSQDITSGSTVVFSAGATGVPTPSYQWRRDGTNLPGQTNATLVIANAAPAMAGVYSVVVNNGGGSVTSAPATLNILTNFNDPGRLVNLSILTPLTAGEMMTMGTVLGGGGTSGAKPLLARAAGPSLVQLGVNSFLPDPTMALVNTSGSPAVTVASNNDWSGTPALSAAFASVGAFAYSGPTSKDAAIFQPNLPAGNYTVQVSDAGTGTGTVIAELYDATAAGTFTAVTPRLVNVSVLKTISAGSSLTVGFYVGGTTSKTVLIRAIGPALGLPPFNISTAMPDPQLTLFNSGQAVIAANNDWGGDILLVNGANRVGAFAVTNAASKDAMLAVTLAPGLYTASVSPVSGTAGGTMIVEVYEIP